MKSNIQIITGPFTSKSSREDAESSLKQDPRFPKNASYTLDAVEGRWIAAFAAPSKRQAAPFGDEPVTPDGEDGPPDADSDFQVDEVIEDESDLGEDDGESDTDKINHLTELVEKMVDALGLSDEGESDDAPVPEEDMMEEPPPAPPPGPTGPAPEPTAVGAPAFSNVQVPNDHPWKSTIGKVRSFNVEEPIGEAKMAQVHKELSKLGSPFGYTVSQLTESKKDGRRTAKAIITCKFAN